MKPITAWFLKQRRDDGTVDEIFNHIEDGHSKTDKPEPKNPDFKNQNWWKGSANWRRDHCWLNEQGAVVYKLGETNENNTGN